VISIKIRIVSSKQEIPIVMPNETMVHLAFRPSNADIFELVKTCPKLEVLQLPKSYSRILSKAIGTFLEMQRITLIEGDVWGHRKDINEYFSVPERVIIKIESMKLECIPDTEIKDAVTRESKLSYGLVSFIVDDIKVN
jgi:hypothetical protein